MKEQAALIRAKAEQALPPRGKIAAALYRERRRPLRQTCGVPLGESGQRGTVAGLDFANLFEALYRFRSVAAGNFQPVLSLRQLTIQFRGHDLAHIHQRLNAVVVAHCR